MKAKQLLMMMLLLATAAGAKAQNYEADVDTLVHRMYKSNVNADYALYASQFQNLAQSEPNRWEASYYAAYCKVMQAYNEKGDKIDALLDEADPIIAAIKKANPNEPEIVVLEAMAAQARIGASPASRGMKYSMLSSQLLEKAIALNPNNPRPYIIKGMNVLYTPAAFGGGKDNAKPLFEMAKERLASFKAPSSIYPAWGYELNEAMLTQCSK